MKRLKIQFYIKLGEGNSVIDQNGNHILFEEVSKNSVDGFYVDENEKKLVEKYDVFINTYYPDYTIIEPVFEVFSVINEKRDEPSIDILEDFDEDEEIRDGEIDIEVIQEWIDKKFFIRNYRDQEIGKVFE